MDAGTWRTYVPVRFAAQAFDCAVGWDQDTSTAIIVDTEKLLETALEGKEFTYLEKLAAYNKKYSEGIWDMAVDLEGNVTFLGAAIPFNGTMEGAMADNDKAAVDMNIKLDLSQFIQTRRRSDRRTRPAHPRGAGHPGRSCPGGDRYVRAF